MICWHYQSYCQFPAGNTVRADVSCRSRSLWHREELENDGSQSRYRCCRHICPSLALWRERERPLLSNLNHSTLGRGEEVLWVFTTIWNVNRWLWVYHLQKMKRKMGLGRKETISPFIACQYLLLQKVWTVQGTLRNPGSIAFQQYLQRIEPIKDTCTEYVTKSYK